MRRSTCRSAAARTGATALVAAICILSAGCRSLPPELPELNPEGMLAGLEEYDPQFLPSADAPSEAPVAAEASDAPGSAGPVEEVLAVVSPAAAEPSAGGAPDAEPYRIAPGDSVQVDVFREPDISRAYPVAADGTIRHPWLGEVRIADRTEEEAATHLTAMLGRDYLVHPHVTVRVRESAARRIMVFGQVKSPGVHVLAPDERFTLLQVLARAGGFTSLADVDRVRIVRTQAGLEESIRVRVSELLGGRTARADVPLHAGDIVHVPERLF